MTWRLEVATVGDPGSRLNWNPVSIEGIPAEFNEAQRESAGRMATVMSELVGPTLIVRMRHRDPRRGAFYPNPLPARLLKRTK